MDKLDNIIESILFLSGNAVEVKDIAEKIGVKVKEVEEAAKLLKDKYSGSSGIHILNFNQKLQFSTNPDYIQEIENVLNPIKERELSKAMMEAAAIIAYKQPVTRLEIEDVRGVNSDYAIAMLCKHNIIEIAGRKDTIGKPLLYQTTDEFLKRFQLNSLDELPDYEELLDRIKILHPENSKDLYYREPYSEVKTENNSETADKENGNNSGSADMPENLSTPENINNVIPEKEELPDFLKGESNIEVINN